MVSSRSRRHVLAMKPMSCSPPAPLAASPPARTVQVQLSRALDSLLHLGSPAYPCPAATTCRSPSLPERWRQGARNVRLADMDVDVPIADARRIEGEWEAQTAAQRKLHGLRQRGGWIGMAVNQAPACGPA